MIFSTTKYHKNSWDVKEFDKVKISQITTTSYSKEIQIILPKSCSLKDHKTSHDIVVQVLKGCVEFGIKDNGVIILNQLDSISLSANVVHNLLAIDDSIIRLSISSLDTKDRVDRVLLS